MARLDAQARCVPGEAHVAVRGVVASNLEERMAKVRGAIEGAGGAASAIGAMHDQGLATMKKTLEKTR